MNLNLKEHLFAENKLGKPHTPAWDWEMTRTIAALYNSGGGILRVGIDDNGTPTGVRNRQDYAADKSPLADVLHKHLDPVPPIEPGDEGSFIKIIVRSGVTWPSILRAELERPSDSKKFPVGTVFIRRMNGPQPSSEPPDETGLVASSDSQSDSPERQPDPP